MHSVLPSQLFLLHLLSFNNYCGRCDRAVISFQSNASAPRLCPQSRPRRPLFTTPLLCFSRPISSTAPHPSDVHFPPRAHFPPSSLRPICLITAPPWGWMHSHLFLGQSLLFPQQLLRPFLSDPLHPLHLQVLPTSGVADYLSSAWPVGRRQEKVVWWLLLTMTVQDVKA